MNFHPQFVNETICNYIVEDSNNICIDPPEILDRHILLTTLSSTAFCAEKET